MSDLLAPDPASDLLAEHHLGDRFAPDQEMVATAHRRAVVAQAAVVVLPILVVIVSVWIELDPSVGLAWFDAVFWGGLLTAWGSWTAWKLAAYRLVPALSGEAPRSSTAMVVFGYVIPIASLWIPYQIMREIAEASDPDAVETDLSSSPARPPVRMWWASVIGLLIVGWVFGADPEAAEASTSIVWDALGLLALALFVAVPTLAFVVVRRVDAGQRRLNALLLDAEANARPEAV